MGERACSSNFSRLIVIVLAARFQMKLPAVAADGHLHDLGGAFVNRGDANVALDLLHHVFVRVAVAASAWMAGVGRQVAGLGRHVLGDGAFGVQAAFAGVDALGGLFNVGAAGLQPRDVRHDQLVRVSLFFRERRAGLDALGGIRNRAIERGPSGAEAEGRHHQARVAEYGLRLIESLAFHAAHQPVGIDIDVIERERGRVAETNAVLVFWLVMLESRRALFHDEPTWTRRAWPPGSCRRRRCRRC